MLVLTNFDPSRVQESLLTCHGTDLQPSAGEALVHVQMLMPSPSSMRKRWNWQTEQTMVPL